MLESVAEPWERFLGPYKCFKLLRKDRSLYRGVNSSPFTDESSTPPGTVSFLFDRVVGDEVATNVWEEESLVQTVSYRVRRSDVDVEVVEKEPKEDDGDQEVVSVIKKVGTVDYCLQGYLRVGKVSCQQGDLNHGRWGCCKGIIQVGVGLNSDGYRSVYNIVTSETNSFSWVDTSPPVTTYLIEKDCRAFTVIAVTLELLLEKETY
ncbi:hypothetical protein L208DRAFT_1376744 [Tricholoma matsutake]|nr:hypothetical protein L208DRAFT_1376744 [Tricholoma matsutake 945]